MKLVWLCLVMLACLALQAAGQKNCVFNGPYECSGGGMLGLDFGKDEDDDTFEYYSTIRAPERINNQTDALCSMRQRGKYNVKGDKVKVSFDDDDCLVGGLFPEDCQCQRDLKFTVSENCGRISGPNGEVCTSITDCTDQFECDDDSEPQPDLSYERSSNGCGPSSIPVAGPAFSFGKCCEAHDHCYGTCGASKVKCDHDFYQCMSCSCDDEYSVFLFELTCQEVACTYFQAVDEYGCSSFKNGQNNSCMCGNKKKKQALHKAADVPNKFGPGDPLARRVEGSTIVCQVPFEPSCENYSSSEFEEESSSAHRNGCLAAGFLGLLAVL